MNWNAASRPNGAVNWGGMAQQIQSRDDFVGFLQALLSDLRERPKEWENRDLASFLEAMAAWVEDMEGYYENRAEPTPEQPSWKTLGQILLAARTYE